MYDICHSIVMPHVSYLHCAQHLQQVRKLAKLKLATDHYT